MSFFTWNLKYVAPEDEKWVKKVLAEDCEALRKRMIKCGLKVNHPVVVCKMDPPFSTHIRWKVDPLIRELIDNGVMEMNYAHARLTPHFYMELCQRNGGSFQYFEDEFNSFEDEQFGV